MTDLVEGRGALGDYRAGDQVMDAADAIESIMAAFMDTWNRHDMAAFAALFHEDAAFVNILGMSWRGRSEIEHWHAQLHATLYRNSAVLTQEIEMVMRLEPAVVVGIARLELQPDAKRPETKTARMTVALHERDGRWLIAAAHNTEIQPPSTSLRSN